MSQDVLKIDRGTQTPSTASLDHRVLWLNSEGGLKGKVVLPLTGTIKSAFFQPRPSSLKSTFAFDTIMHDVKPLNAPFQFAVALELLHLRRPSGA